jgi:ornithine cyclodeaminase/alanine dehydrogenase-like protein (mu-crystallin family)
MSSTRIRLLSRDDVRRALSMAEAINLMKEAFTQLSSGQAVVPQRLSMEMPALGGRALVMPVHLAKSGQFGMKIVSLFRQNPEKGLPLIHAVMLVFDASDGHPVALMDAEYLTALRTGAASGLATDLLARTDARTVVIFGAGAQGRLQLEGVCAVRRISRAVVFDPNPERAEKFCRDMSAIFPFPITSAASPAAVAEADVICTATTSKNPVFDDASLRKGTHINAVGAYRPDMCEIPQASVVRAKIIVDHRSSSLVEAGDLLGPIERGVIDAGHIQAELGEIVAGQKQGRKDEGEITIFKSVGNAAQDLAAAAQVLRNAEQCGLGSEFQL